MTKPTKKSKATPPTVVLTEEELQFRATLATAGMLGNSRTVMDFGRNTFGEVSLVHCMEALEAAGKALDNNDLKPAVTMLTAQAVALDAIFSELARRSAQNMGTYLDATERYLRLALKAQSQCRATLETIATIKNPPIVIARQANFNQGGQQQINNGSTTSGTAPRAGEQLNEPNKLLEDLTHERETLDFGTTAATRRENPHLEPVETLHRATKHRG